MPVIIDGQADPQYVAIPYLLIRNGPQWVGVLVDHPGNVFMDTGSNWFFSGKDELGAPPSLWFGADEGVPAFYLIVGASAGSVTQRLQRLVVVTPPPPLWSLGHHQCRWGYAGTRDLDALDKSFDQHRGWKALRVAVVGYDGARSAVITLASGEVTQALVHDTWTFSGQPLYVARGAVLTI